MKKRLLAILMISLCGLFLCGFSFGGGGFIKKLESISSQRPGETLYSYNSTDKKIIFYDMDVLEEALDIKKPYTYADVRKAIAGNKQITDRWAPYFYNVTDWMEKKYPDMNLTCFYLNIKNLEVHATSEQGMQIKFLNKDTIGVFKPSENALWINEDYDDLDYVLYHEICHMVTNLWTKDQGYKMFFDFDYNQGTHFMEEALDSIFMEEISGLTKENNSYQLAMNYMRVFVDNMDPDMDEFLKRDNNYFFDEIDREIPSDKDWYTYKSLLNKMQQIGWEKGKAPQPMEGRLGINYPAGWIFFNRQVRSNMKVKELTALYEGLVKDLMHDVYNWGDEDTSLEFDELQTAFFEVLEHKGVSKAEYPKAAALTKKVTIKANSSY